MSLLSTAVCERLHVRAAASGWPAISPTFPPPQTETGDPPLRNTTPPPLSATMRLSDSRNFYL